MISSTSSRFLHRSTAVDSPHLVRIPENSRSVPIEVEQTVSLLASCLDERKHHGTIFPLLHFPRFATGCYPAALWSVDRSTNGSLPARFDLFLPRPRCTGVQTDRAHVLNRER